MFKVSSTEEADTAVTVFIQYQVIWLKLLQSQNHSFYGYY